MTAVESVNGPRVASRGRLWIGIAGVLVLAVVFVAGLLWAKWIPYGQKASKFGGTPGRAALCSPTRGSQARC